MKSKIKDNLPIVLILLLAAFLYVWKIWGAGFANQYYAAGVYSMGQNLYAFFYNSLDSAGFVTIDKPPLGFWIQVLFTKVFGFSGVVLILPEAISGVLSVYMIYRIINKRFGKIPGLISALVLALTPIFAAVSRNNTIDGILILLLVLAADQAIKAAEKGSVKHLIFSGILIGLGFNVKMLQAFMIVPAVYLTYLIFAKQKFLKRMLACFISVIILLAISLSWVVAVDLTDEENRPYIGSSDTNSAVELAIGYNGLNRIFGRGSLLNSNTASYDDGNGEIKTRSGAIAPGGDYADLQQRPPENRQALPPNGSVPTQTAPMQTFGGAAGEAGDISFVRLFNDKNAGQISWFVIPAMVAALSAIALIFIKKYRQDKKMVAYFFFAMSFIPMYIYFSFAGGLTHRYYFAMLGPPIAAVIGIGFYYLLKMKKKIWIPTVFAVTALSQLYILSLYEGWLDWLVPVCTAIFGISFAAMVIMMALKKKTAAIAAFLAVLIILPGIWAATPALYSDNSQLPISGPELVRQNDGFDNVRDMSALVEYLEENREGATYLVMAESSMQNGAELILQSGEAVMVLGGFNGGDPILTLDEFIAMVDDGEVKYAYISGESGRNQENVQILDWIKATAKVIRPREYGGFAGNSTLYKLS